MFFRSLNENSSNSNVSNIESRIAKLDDLRKKGLIDDEDYEEQKDRILSEL